MVVSDIYKCNKIWIPEFASRLRDPPCPCASVVPFLNHGGTGTRRKHRVNWAFLSVKITFYRTAKISGMYSMWEDLKSNYICAKL